MRGYTASTTNFFSYHEQNIARSDDGCWIWTGRLGQDGYGKASLSGRDMRCHRAAWEATHGSVPRGMWVLHKCDTPACVRPDHLFLGTPQDNVRDRDAKARQVRGALHHKAKLSAESVLEIRDRRSNGEPIAKLATDFGVGQANISMIVTRRTWRHI